MKKIWVESAISAVLAAWAVLGAFVLRFGFEIPDANRGHLMVALPVFVAIKLAVFHWFGLNRRAWWFFSLADVVLLLRASVVSSMLASVAVWLLAPAGFPAAVVVLDLLLCFLLVGARFAGARVLSESRRARRPESKGHDVLIYGAGRAGVALLGELRLNPSLGYTVRGFVDDDPHLQGMFIQGTPVLARGADLASAAQALGISEVLIAVPSASADQMLEILRNCQRARLRYRTIATLGEVVEGSGIASRIRDVDVQDLLPRRPAELDLRLLRENIEGRVVMITGAAGSIGSELCRQIARFSPSAIVGYEAGETPLFHLSREMAARFPNITFHGEIGSIQNYRRVCAVLDRYKPAIIYHAAAYKHVPIMESAVTEAVANNVCGTAIVAAAAREYGVERFVLISSDKAVRPSSMMGATKRLCEHIIVTMPRGKTRFSAVRFGNVLGSNGSVIPVFKQQIAAGGPVTVTHPEMRRYFMTIPEAAQLVLQASSMGQGGEIFILDMGEQVRIVDVARKLILLSGLTPGVDVQIEFTGMRPGEKLAEELSLAHEEALPTSHRKIRIFSGTAPPPDGMQQHVERMRVLCEQGRAGELIALIRQLLPEYCPSDVVLAAAAPPLKGPQMASPGTLAHPAAAAAAGSQIV